MSEPASRRLSGTISIGEVLTMLKREFPDITISKIRFLESEGLVTPERTPSGYRRFTDRDIEQLRSVLTLQRDQYLPLKVIREHLNEPAEQQIAAVAGTGLQPEDYRPGAGRVRMTRTELAEHLDVPEPDIVQLEANGLVWCTAAGYYDEDALAIVSIFGRLAQFGVEPRHLRSFRVVADRDSGLVEQIAAPHASPRDLDAKARVQETIRELAAMFIQLHAALLRANLIRGGKG